MARDVYLAADLCGLFLKRLSCRCASSSVAYRMGKLAKVQASSWYDVRAKALDPDVLKHAVRDGRIVEYCVPTDVDGIDQGCSLFVPVDGGVRTNKGLWVTGVHIAASDPDFENYAAGMRPTGEGLFLFHFCSSASCGAHSQRESFLSHIKKFRLLSIAAAEKLGYGQDMLAEYRSSISGAPAGAGVDLGDSSGGEEAAIRQALKRGGTPSAGAADGAPPANEGLNTQGIWAHALRGGELGPVEANTDHQMALDAQLANSLQRHLTAGDVQAGIDAQAGKAPSPAKPPGRLPFQFQNAALASFVGATGPAPGATPVGAPPPSPVGLAPARVQEAPTVPKASGTCAPAVPPPASPAIRGRAGEELNKRLAEFASKQAAKRALSAPIGPQSKAQRLAQSIADLVGGSSVDGTSTDIVPWEPGVDDGFGASPFGPGASSSSVATTPVLAAARPGDLFAMSLERIRERLSAIHGDSALAQEGRRLVTFYHEVIFKPKVKADFSFKMEREMKTLVEGIDALLEGSLDRVGDVLMGRYKALEDASTSGSWAVAREFEAVPQVDDGLVTDAERQRAVALQLRRVRLQTALRSVRGGGAAAIEDGPG